MDGQMAFRANDPPTMRYVKAVLRRARRTAPCPDAIPYAMWRNAGVEGAETLCLFANGFPNGLAVPPRFNEAWSFCCQRAKRRRTPLETWCGTRALSGLCC